MRNVLVIGSENLSKIVNWKDRKTCVLFGDGAGAAVIRPVAPGSGVLSHKLYADGSGGKYLNLPAGGSRTPASHETVDGNLHYIHMRGRDVFRFAVRATARSATEVLGAAGLKMSDVDYFVPHRQTESLTAAKSCGCRWKSPVNVDRYGNHQQPQPIALTEAVRAGRIKEPHLMVGLLP